MAYNNQFSPLLSILQAGIEGGRGMRLLHAVQGGTSLEEIRFSSFTFTKTYRSRMMSWDLLLSPYKEITAQEAFIKGTKMDNSVRSCNPHANKFQRKMHS